MKKAKRRLLVVLGAGLSVSVSCSRTPDEDRTPAPASSPAGDANDTANERSHESSGPAVSLSTPKETSIAAETAGQQAVADSAVLRFVSTQLDINSGDIRRMRSILAGPPPCEIHESELSKEVRRLGIPIPEERRWQVIFRPSHGGMDIMYVYADLLPTARSLLNLFDKVQAADEERRAVLERFMMYLRTEEPPEIVGTPL